MSIVLAACLLAGCVALHKESLFGPDRDEVYVAFFDNNTFYRGLELALTESVVEEIHSRPGLRLTSKEEADVYLKGTLTRIRQRVLSENTNRLVTSENTRVTVKIELMDAATEDLILQRTLRQSGEFVPELGEDIESAQREAFAFLARDIVRLLEKDF